MKGVKSGAHTRYDLRYHFVWCPRYRKRVLKGDIAKRIEGMIRFAAQINEWEIYELAVQLEHIHLYMGAAPKWSPSEMMRIIKGGTSKKIMKLFPELDEVFWGTNTTFWCDGYFVKTAGAITDKVISEYVRRQRKDYK